MDAIISCTKKQFHDVFEKALIKLGVDEDKAKLFCCHESTLRLKDLGICTNLSITLDDMILNKISDYKGCLVHETYSIIEKYNFTDD